MIFKINVPVPSKLELFLAKIFGKRRVGQCLDSCVEIYTWRGRSYVTKQWIDENYGVEK